MEENTELQNIEQPSQFMQQTENTPPASGMGMQDASAMIESLLSNSHVPKPLLKQLWVLFSKSAKLTFLTDEEVNYLMLEFELIRITIIESLPKSYYNEELEMELIQLGMEFKMTLNRAKGVGQTNERFLLGSSTSATFSDRPLNMSHEKSFLDKLGHLFGGK